MRPDIFATSVGTQTFRDKAVPFWLVALCNPSILSIKLQNLADLFNPLSSVPNTKPRSGGTTLGKPDNPYSNSIKSNQTI